MIRSAAQILADIAAQHGEPDIEVPVDQPDTTEPADDRPRRLRGVVDIDLGAGRLLVGYDDIRRHAQVWIGQAPPEEPQPNPRRKGCPSEGQYRRHLAAGERCSKCRAYVRQLEKARRAKWGRR